MSLPVPSRYRIVPARASRRGLAWPLLALAWAASLAALACWLPRGGGPAGRRDPSPAALQDELARARAELAELRRRQALAAQSDRISRAANRDLQDTLTERDGQIAALRADVAFYQRLVGPTARPSGLGVYSSRFEPAGGDAWNYRIVLTQTLNRGAVSQGSMRLAIAGQRDGRDEVLEGPAVQPAPQAFSFRYFQELQGSVRLPAGFVPRQVRVSLLAGDQAAVQQQFPWPSAGT
ncbi:MAG: hypothetical protein QM601_08150 [Pseudoxanthomonas sp.]